ncbi:MAG: hypothetical protein DM484_13030 [Candidatus Methylumidiphilus alinenensis]|uniref:Uncharacterized protein n=1 Tax=Candidatus Methylumidiphilus alinenensis TaxID=2202197 RepID=A0A2W4REK5_9GAMM|nr:MAG: hypothetical protein DM484_13030 [Candidatus Methylumidiphilus alinenensis]
MGNEIPVRGIAHKNAAVEWNAMRRTIAIGGKTITDRANPMQFNFESVGFLSSIVHDIKIRQCAKQSDSM